MVQTDTILQDVRELLGEEIAHPPKRGAQNTLSVFCDYLRGTIPAITAFRVSDPETGEVVEFVEPPMVTLRAIFGELKPLERNSAKGYTHSAIMSCGGTVHWHESDPSQRILVNLGGRALAELGVSPLELMDKLDRVGFQVTRQDWAKDDDGNLLDLKEIERKLKAGEYVSRFRSGGKNESFLLGDGDKSGVTLYIGDRTSESFVRIYDKAAEQKTEGTLIRCEVEFKKRKAQKLWGMILEAYRGNCDEEKAKIAVSDVIMSTFYGLFDFKEPGQDTNKSRWDTSSWWAKFVEVGQKLKVVLDKPEATLESAKNWLTGQVAIVGAMVTELDPEFLLDMLKSGVSRMGKKHKTRFDRWSKELENSLDGILKFQHDVEDFDRRQEEKERAVKEFRQFWADFNAGRV